MPQPVVVDGSIIFQPTGYEVIKNNKNKQMRIEHQQLLEEVATLKRKVAALEKSKNRSVRVRKGRY